jgi:antirestriction protein ArdC
MDKIEQKSKDIYQELTDKIVYAIEKGAVNNWQMPWHMKDGSSLLPANVLSKKTYRGINILSLWVTVIEKGYSSNLWGTYKQWQELGAQVRKGEKSTLVTFWKVRELEQETESEEESNSKKLFIARGYPVFNADQVNGFEAEKESIEPQGRIKQAEEFFRGLKSSISHGGNKAFYSFEADQIVLPVFEVFKDPLNYYGTLAHEHIHWTAHESRLNRNLENRFGSESYAFEELIAELGSAFLSASLGLVNEPRAEQVSYLNSWLKVLKGDKRAIFTASSKAQEAIDWMYMQFEKSKVA